jgi:hypothetical protein
MFIVAEVCGGKFERGHQNARGIREHHRNDTSDDDVIESEEEPDTNPLQAL